MNDIILPPGIFRQFSAVRCQRKSEQPRYNRTVAEVGVALEQNNIIVAGEEGGVKDREARRCRRR